MECLTYCISERISLSKVEHTLREQTDLHVIKHWRALEISSRSSEQRRYIFSNGTIVTWGVKRYDIAAYLDWLKPFCENYLETPLIDDFSYSIGEKTSIAPHPYFSVDCITLENHDSDLKLSLSYGVSQSIKLKYYEEKVEKLINQQNPFIKKLTEYGPLACPRKALRQVIGNILTAKSEINLTMDFLYQPKFFWSHPNLEVYFIMVERYLDIPERTNALNQKLNTLNEVFLMYNSHLDNQYAHGLEIIIIVLIMVEITLTLIGFH
jgi:required for meiotic nuclear division protein 1